MRRITTIALLSAGVIALGGLSAACEPADNEPQAKRTVTERTATAAKRCGPEALRGGRERLRGERARER